MIPGEDRGGHVYKAKRSSRVVLPGSRKAEQYTANRTSSRRDVKSKGSSQWVVASKPYIDTVLKTQPSVEDTPLEENNHRFYHHPKMWERKIF